MINSSSAHSPVAEVPAAIRLAVSSASASRKPFRLTHISAVAAIAIGALSHASVRTLSQPGEDSFFANSCLMTMSV